MLVSNPCTVDARVIKMAEGAAKNGHEVHVFATIGNNSISYELKNNVHYHRIEWNLSLLVGSFFPIKVLKKINRRVGVFFIKKLAPFVKYSLFRKIFIDEIQVLDPDIVHAHDLICLPLGSEVSKKTGAKLIYDAHELEVYRNPPLPVIQKFFVSHVEKKFSKDSDAVISVCKHGAKVLSQRLDRNIHVIYNSPILESSKENIRSDLRISDSVPLMLYVGKVTFGRGIEDLLRLLTKLPGIHFAVVGPCDVFTYKKFLNLSRKLNIEERFTILPPVNFKKVVNYIRGADLGVISIDTTTLSYRLAMPNKLFEMTFAEIPIIAKKGLVEIEEFINEIGNGKIVDFERCEALEYQITKLFDEKEIYSHTLESRKVLEDEYSWTAQVDRLLKIYEHLETK
jgi:glycosyltransferase involved in cell wall biosynthesis